MKLSVIMPVYNEKETILDAIQKLEQAELHGVDKEIIIVDDGSTDGTREILSGLNKHKIVFHIKNKGMGYAFRTGLLHATGDIAIKQDADLEYDPDNIAELITHMGENNLDAVYGSRFLNTIHKEIPLHYFGNKMLTSITNMLYRSKLTDMETCYKLVKLDLLKSLNLKANRFDLEPEITAKLHKKKCRVSEVQIKYTARKFNQGKKITWRDGVKALYYLFKYRFLN